jgi:prevent-host-death family protein
MKHFTATEAKNRFGEMLEMSALEAVVIEKNGRDVAVLLSKAEYDRIMGSTTIDADVRTSLERSMKRWNRVYEALAK